ncbi:hypothetical protein MIND_00023600 [Mycena indigotica]|uniref:NAD(P)-binding protein n=1 Tax=Mycena indigotica TaxID=2126181 RepID=A0A8H6TD36_9AGAR|nr:uncharacterized protein MIND_00023600 [Mycena indigotica]KAF7315094.1 hypothetical protein MIND_00023600 [Mycena indigotica]
MSLLCLSGSDVAQVTTNLSPETLQNLMAHVFFLLSASDPKSVFMPHRTPLPMQNHLSLFMPARLVSPALTGTSIKIVSVPTSPTDMRGLPASTLVLDEDSGTIRAILNASRLTALRNAAARHEGSLLSCNLVGPRQPSNIVAFGAGAQISAHLDIFLRAFPTLKRCTIVNRTLNDRAERLVQHLRARFDEVQFEFIAHDANKPNASLRSTLLSAQLVVCATSSTIPLFPSSHISNGTHIILIGSYKPTMHEVDSTLIRRALLVTNTLLVDSRSACAIEAGELIDAQVESSQITEIGELVSFDATTQELQIDPHRKSLQFHEGQTDGSITIFKSVGVGLQDVAIACAVVKQAEDMELGTRVDWD